MSGKTGKQVVCLASLWLLRRPGRDEVQLPLAEAGVPDVPVDVPQHRRPQQAGHQGEDRHLKLHLPALNSPGNTPKFKTNQGEKASPVLQGTEADDQAGHGPRDVGGVAGGVGVAVDVLVVDRHGGVHQGEGRHRRQLQQADEGAVSGLGSLVLLASLPEHLELMGFKTLSF